MRSRVIRSPSCSVALTSACVTGRVRELAEARLRLLRRLEGVGAGLCEEVVKLGGTWNEAEPHEARGMVQATECVE